ncbi:MAG: AMP-binding enzyme [Gemmatimonadales bacterium]
MAASVAETEIITSSSGNFGQAMYGGAEVADVAVIGVPHDKWGETPLALVIKRPGAALAAGDLKRWADERLPKYQRIERVEFREELPRNALGKLLKNELRKPYWRTRD